MSPQSSQPSPVPASPNDAAASTHNDSAVSASHHHAAQSGVRVQVLVRQGCHLCTDALATVAEVCDRLGVAHGVLHGEEHPDLLERHSEEIPVLFVDGVQRDFWRVDPARLERLLTAHA